METSSKKTFGDYLRLGWLVAWVIAVFVPIGYLMGFHLAPISGSVSVSHATSSLSVPREPSEWGAVHILSVDCDCSKRIAEILLARLQIEHLKQKVILIGRDESLARSFSEKGYLVESGASEELLENFGVKATPLFVLLKPNNDIAYSGGYAETRTPTSGAVRDLKIYETLKFGRSIASLPVFGCANGKKLRTNQDPLGLKYR